MKISAPIQKFIKVIYWIFSFLPLIVTLYIFPGAPAVIPAHYGANNTVDRWGSKYELLILPIITVAFAFAGWLYNKLHNKKSENSIPVDVISAISCVLCCIIVFNILTFIILFHACNKLETFNSEYRIFATPLNLFYIVMGAVLPKIKQNEVIGIRVSWTLKNEEVWNLTHRFGGKVWMAGGLVLLIVCLIIPDYLSLIVSVAGMLIMTVPICIYAHNEYVRITGSKK